MALAGYLQARVQARYALLPDEALWREFDAAGDLAGYLAVARESVLAPWVHGIYARSDSDEIEQRLSARFASTLEESAEWAPRAWRAAIRGLGDLLHSTVPPEGWAQALRNWESHLPSAHTDLAELESVLSGHAQAFARDRPRDAALLRRRCEGDLRRLFRRTICRPAALFIWLALVLLQLERLRGELVVRALYPEGDLPFGGG